MPSISGSAIRFIKFQVQPASAIVASKMIPLKHSTAKPSKISVARRNANQSESSTSTTIGVTTCHILDCTRLSVALPSNSQPDSSAWFCARFFDKAASSAASTLFVAG